jgi:hypothetical protein
MAPPFEEPGMTIAHTPLRSASHRRLMIGMVQVALVLSGLVVSGYGMPAQEVNPRGLAVQEFNKRMADYVSLHKRAAGKVPPLKETDLPEQIEAREKALGEAIRQARAGAKPGELFEPIASIVRGVVKQDWEKRSVRERKALLTEVPKGMRVVPNMVYPTTLPLATSPPALIQALPRLSNELEYRFMGRHIILRDVKANIVVDVLENVIPPVTS